MNKKKKREIIIRSSFSILYSTRITIDLIERKIDSVDETYITISFECIGHRQNETEKSANKPNRTSNKHNTRHAVSE